MMRPFDEGTKLKRRKYEKGEGIALERDKYMTFSPEHQHVLFISF